jgi:hypothetical protein
VPKAIPRFYWCCGDPAFIAHLSLALRSGPNTGIIVKNRDEPALPLPDLDGYFWRDEPR